jgi:hypothetical protein
MQRLQGAAHGTCLAVDPYDLCAMFAMANPGTEAEAVSESRSVSGAS